MVFNALSISATIITISVLSMEPRPRIPGWLDRLGCKSGKVNVNMNPNANPTETEIEDEDAIHKSQQFTSEIVKSDPEQDQLDEKWKNVAKFMNRCLFLLFSVTFTILLSTIFAFWILGEEDVSQVL